MRLSATEGVTLSGVRFWDKDCKLIELWRSSIHFECRRGKRESVNLSGKRTKFSDIVGKYLLFGRVALRQPVCFFA